MLLKLEFRVIKKLNVGVYKKVCLLVVVLIYLHHAYLMLTAAVRQNPVAKRITAYLW